LIVLDRKLLARRIVSKLKLLNHPLLGFRELAPLIVAFFKSLVLFAYTSIVGVVHRYLSRLLLALIHPFHLLNVIVFIFEDLQDLDMFRVKDQGMAEPLILRKELNLVISLY
jgi:hypothetical protein